MLWFAIFIAGFTLGVFATLKIFAPEQEDEQWDPQQFAKPPQDFLRSRRVHQIYT